LLGEGGSPTLSHGMDAVRVCPRALQGRKANQAYTAFHGERGQFGKDAEIRTHQALHEAKPSECPNGDRDNKSEVCFKNRLFLQAVTAVFCGCFFSPHYLKSRQKNAIIVKVYRQTLMSVGWK